METPWGQLAVRDAHVHFFSRRFFSLLTGGKDVDQTAAQLGWDATEALASRWAGELDRHGVESAALIASLQPDWPSVADAVKQFPQRFHGQFMVNPQAPDGLEVARYAFSTGLRTACLFPAMHRFSLADEKLESLWKLAAGKNIFVHCGVLSVGVRKKLGLPSPFDMRFSNPLDLHHAALRHPAVRFIVPHFGAGMFREALMLADLCPNVYLDTSSTNSWMKYEGLDLETVFRRALTVVGPGRLLFGTDSSYFPRGWVKGVFDTQVEALAAIGISSQDAAAIFGDNLLQLQQ